MNEIKMFDCNGIKLEIGMDVIAFNPDTGMEFSGKVKDIKRDTDENLYAEIKDQKDDVFCVTSINVSSGSDD